MPSSTGLAARTKRAPVRRQPQKRASSRTCENQRHALRYPGMPLPNRVDPFGELFATPARGLLMGNRGGRLHDDRRKLTSRRWASKQWICCRLEFNNRHREVWGDSYTELFFLDEVTAFAAGHRPCFECRRKDAEHFAALFAGNGKRATAGRDGRGAACRAPRRQSQAPAPRVDGLPDGAMIARDGDAFAMRGSTCCAGRRPAMRTGPRPRAARSTCSRRRRSWPCWRAVIRRSGTRAPGSDAPRSSCMYALDQRSLARRAGLRGLLRGIGSMAMPAALRRRRDYAGPALFAYGFRPFFLAAGPGPPSASSSGCRNISAY